jgi:hypothetical protein
MSAYLRDLRLCQPTHGENPAYVHYVSAKWLRGLGDHVEGLETRAADVAAELREWADAARADYGAHSSRAAEYEELAKRLEGAP